MIGQRIREYRKKKGLKLIELAKIIGISHGSLSGIETQKTDPSAETLLKLFSNTDINMSWLFTGKGPMEAKGVMYTEQGYEAVDPRRQAIIRLIIDMPDDKLDDIFKMLEKEKLLMELLEERKRLKDAG